MIGTAYGYNDVVVFSPKHEQKLHEMSSDALALLFEAVSDRLATYATDGRMKHAYVFLSNDARFGPSESHPHGQILVTSFVPPFARRFRTDNGDCFLCQENHRARLAGRVFMENRFLTAFTPSAPRLPLEMWIVPEGHGVDLWALPPENRAALALATLTSLGLAANVTGYHAPYLVSLFNVLDDGGKSGHILIEVQHYGRPGGREKFLGGFELSLGLYANPSSPDDIAALLKDALSRTSAQVD
jgi:UDPglucose--hexose-1-phosphate uridylyltransferase